MSSFRSSESRPPETGVGRPSVPPQLIARIVDVLHPEQVWLFGSRARGDARGDSDWDFMAILPDSAPDQDLDLISVWRRLRDLRLQRVEVFTITQAEFETWKGSLGTLAEIVASTGCCWWRRSDKHPYYVVDHGPASVALNRGAS